jgi:O-antigen ligase
VTLQASDPTVVTAETSAPRDDPGPTRWRSQLGAWLDSPGYLLGADIIAATMTASLPWSTTAASILIVVWLIVVIPTLDGNALVRRLAHPACALPLMIFALSVIGTLWSDGTWPERLHGIKPVSKLLLIPLLLYHFQRSPRGRWVFFAFLSSCALLMILSWIVLFYPALKLTPTASAGVPVKNYIDQSQEFALCAFVIALPALISLRRRRPAAAVGWFGLIVIFIANMMFVASARTALLYMPVLLTLFASLHLGRRAMLALFVGAAVAGALIWTTSPYLRKRVADIAVEYHGYETNKLGSTAQRLNYWRKSLQFIADAPLFGHGTGSIKRLFERDAVGQTGLRAEVVNNPHNQTLGVALQWGVVGVFVLYAMWCCHLALFTRGGLAAWAGLVVVVQNVVSSLLNSHLFDFSEGWIYVLGVGIAGGMSLQMSVQPESSGDASGVDMAKGQQGQSGG